MKTKLLFFKLSANTLIKILEISILMNSWYSIIVKKLSLFLFYTIETLKVVGFGPEWERNQIVQRKIKIILPKNAGRSS